MEKMSIIFPVYNEEKRLEHGVTETIRFLKSISYEDYEIIIADNASLDKTPEVAQELRNKYDKVKYIRLQEKGVGVAFRAGVKESKYPIVGYMDVDLSTDITHLRDVFTIFDEKPETEIVNGSRQNKKSVMKGRKWYRVLTSHGLTWLLKLSLGLKATDAICGFKFFRRDTVTRLMSSIEYEDPSWFYVIELLLRAERSGVKIYELPVRWQDDYRTTVNVRKQIRDYCVQIIRLRRTFRKEKKMRKKI